ncbi:MAG TPA: type II toxin-antitoxin system VapC family toxin [Actinomycetota bacterium]
MVLLDTHAFLWWIGGDDRLSERAADLIRDPDTQVFVSAASVWEIAIKAADGRINLLDPPDTYIPRQMEANSFRGLAIQFHHALGVQTLPVIHRDPFDRLLVAQAIAEDLTLITRDPQIARYDVRVAW